MKIVFQGPTMPSCTQLKPPWQPKILNLNHNNAVKRMFGLHLIKTGEIEKDFAKILTAEQEDRAIGDYNIYIEIEQDRALKRVRDAEKFVERIEKYLQT